MTWAASIFECFFNLTCPYMLHNDRREKALGYIGYNNWNVVVEGDDRQGDKSFSQILARITCPTPRCLFEYVREQKIETNESI